MDLLENAKMDGPRGFRSKSRTHGLLKVFVRVLDAWAEMKGYG